MADDHLAASSSLSTVSNAHDEPIDCAQIVDPDGNVYTVSSEQLSAVGLEMSSLSNMSDSQLSALLSMVDIPSKQLNGSKTEETYEDGQQPPPSNDLTLMVQPDGTLQVTDTTNQTFQLTCDQLREYGIDGSNLTSDNIQLVAQLAMQSFNRKLGGDEQTVMDNDLAEPSNKYARYDQPRSSMSDSVPQPAVRRGILGRQAVPLMHSGTYSNEQLTEEDLLNADLLRQDDHSMPPAMAPMSMIGREVLVTKQTSVLAAVVRYSRPGSGYKVQFSDGHFEWVSEAQVRLRGSEETSMVMGEQNTTKGQARPIKQSSSPLKQYTRVSSTADVNGDKHLSHHVHAAQQSTSTSTANFNCPVCERHVHQKQPAYIVIRLPACDECADSKILVLDQEKETDGQASAADTVTKNTINLDVTPATSDQYCNTNTQPLDPTVNSSPVPLDNDLMNCSPTSKNDNLPPLDAFDCDPLTGQSLHTNTIDHSNEDVAPSLNQINRD